MNLPLDALDKLVKAVGDYALEKGEDWRTGEGSEIMDAYENAIHCLCGKEGQLPLFTGDFDAAG